MPKSQNLTAKGIERMRAPPEGQVDRFDAILPGFAIRVSATGTRSFVVFYRFGGKLRRLTIGRYPTLSLADARERARKALRDVERGRDPRHEKEEQKRQLVDTFDAVVAEFIKRHAKPNLRSWQEYERVFRVYIPPSWGERPISQIARRDVIRLLDRIVEQNGPYMANRVLAHIRKLFNWAVERDIIGASPVTGVKAPGKETSRDRVLSDEEIASIWNACDQLGYPFGGLIRLLMITGQRRDEVSRMKWSDLDLENTLWSLPREQTKSDRAHDVPLPSLAIEVLSMLPRSGEFVFSSGRRGDRPVNGFSVAKRRLDNLSDVTDWRLHDLRRTAASGMAKLNVPPHVVEKVLNHSTGTLGGVAGVYNRYGYLDEKRHALEVWARRIEVIIRSEPSNIVELSMARNDA